MAEMGQMKDMGKGMAQEREEIGVKMGVMELSYLSSSDRKIKLRWNDAFNMPLLCLLYPCDLGGSHAAIVSQPLEFIYDFNDVRTSWSRLSIRVVSREMTQLTLSLHCRSVTEFFHDV